MNYREIIEWLDTEEGQSFLNDTHRQCPYAHVWAWLKDDLVGRCSSRWRPYATATNTGPLHEQMVFVELQVISEEEIVRPHP